MFLRRKLCKKFFLLILSFIFFMTFLLQDDGNPSSAKNQKSKQSLLLRAAGGNGDSIQHQKEVRDFSSYYSQHLSEQVRLSHRQQQTMLDDITPIVEKQNTNTGIPVRYRNVANEYSLTKTITVSNMSESYQSYIPPTWLRISDDMYTYSAHWDTRDGLQPAGPVVRIMGILRYRKEHLHEKTGVLFNGNIKEEFLNCSCFLWYTGQNYKKGQLRAFVYEEGLKVFVGTYFLCYPPQRSSAISSDKRETSMGKNIPYAVSLAPHGFASNTHKLIYIRTSEELPNNSSGLCVRPLFGPYSDVRSITQFISYYNTVLSISHFYFYDLAVDKTVREFLDHLTPAGVTIQVLPWNLPTNAWEDLWDFGSLTALNDCIYRSAGLHHHIAIVDIDEFIVPRTSVANLAQVYQNVLKYKHGEEGDAALILNAFYCSEFENSTKLTDALSFPIFHFKQRELRLWPAESRSKMILIPLSVISVGHHMVHNFLHKYLKNRASPKHVSVLHHYRSCSGVSLGKDGTGPPVLKQGSVKDAAMLRYKQRILASPIMAVYKMTLMS